MKQTDLLNDNVKKLFFRYLIPSVSATLVTSIYVLADTIFIGKGISDTAVAALNIIIPLFSLYFGMGLLFGVGGSVLLSVAKGQGDEKKANTYFTVAFIANGITSLIFLIINLVAFDQIAYLLGASETTIGYIREYGMYFIWGIPFFCFSSFLQAFVRNDKAPKLSMIAVISGGVINIIIDYVFIYIFDMGMGGASLATVLGSVVSCLILSTHFLSKSNTLHLVKQGLQLRYFGDVTKNGFSSFLIEMSSGIVIFIFNNRVLHYIGDVGVTVYSIISNTAIIVSSLSNGISQAAQPLLALNYGAGKYDRINQVKRLGLGFSFATGIVFAVVGFCFPEFVVGLFIHPSKEVQELAPMAIQIYFISFILMVPNIFYSNYFQSTLQPIYALIICVLRGLILSGVLVYILPTILGVKGIWMTMIFVECITLAVIIAFVLREKRQSIEYK
ncbi:putative efflux protein, MATE family [Anaerosporobacter mobilis DSM 15930]|jgi:putative MATE family efflux protein|uniref:Multidrug export protein MepA n=1 Tax=Anaerosporobacter mobilis DSM 15930 TaxID=1120996 RepID=A0A1M7K0C1_9FIRM|nr:MATE family efflux transporter [Anaerosporobacter mobilis]SHM58257.1 putative efflux protein, MATE family [Anaerosporobacter mobilis DSM 15930]